MKPLPHDLESEKILLSAIMKKNDTISDIIDIVSYKDFYNSTHSFIFQTFTEMYNKNIPIEIISFANYIGQDKLKSIGGITYLSTIIEAYITGNVKYYAELIKEKSNKRNIIETCQNALEKAYAETAPTVEIVENIENSFLNMNELDEEKTVNLNEMMLSTVNSIEENYKNGGTIVGTTTGYQDLDKATNGMIPGDLWIIAARPSMGKTLLTLNMARHLPKNKKAIIFELEMTKEKLGNRFISAMTGLNSIDISRGKVADNEFTEIINACNAFTTKDNLFINCKSGIGLSYIRSEAKRIKLKYGLNVIFIDHIGKIRPSNLRASRNDQLGEISEGLKTLAKDLNVTVVALSQLSRACEARTDKRPQLADLRDSGNLEQDADTVMMLYRDDYYAERENRESKKPNILEAFIPKNRDGEVGGIEFYCNLEKQLIGDLTRITEVPTPKSIEKGWK